MRRTLFYLAALALLFPFQAHAQKCPAGSVLTPLTIGESALVAMTTRDPTTGAIRQVACIDAKGEITYPGLTASECVATDQYKHLISFGAACGAGGGAPAPPRYSIQYNNPLGFFDGSSTFASYVIGGAAPDEILAVDLSGGTNFEIDALTDPSNNNLFSIGPHTFIYSNGANGPGFAGGIQAIISDASWPPEGFPAPVTVTNVAITSNVLTVTNAGNSTTFKGEYVIFSGVTSAAFLNGVIVYVTYSDATHLYCTYTHADYVSAADTGTAAVQSSSGPIPYYVASTIHKPGAGSIGLQAELGGNNSTFPYAAGTLIGVLADFEGRYDYAYGFDAGATYANKESARIRVEGALQGGTIHDYSVKVEASRTPTFYVYANGDTWTRGNHALVIGASVGACTQTVGAGLWDCVSSQPSSFYAAPQSETMTVKFCTTDGPNDSIDWSSTGVPDCTVPTLIPNGNVLDIADNIRLTFGAHTGHTAGDTGTIAVTVTAVHVYAGAQATRDDVRTEVGLTGAIGSFYLSTGGKAYLKVANANATADWQRVTTTAAD